MLAPSRRALGRATRDFFWDRFRMFQGPLRWEFRTIELSLFHRLRLACRRWRVGPSCVRIGLRAKRFSIPSLRTPRLTITSEVAKVNRQPAPPDGNHAWMFAPTEC